MDQAALAAQAQETICKQDAESLFTLYQQTMQNTGSKLASYNRLLSTLLADPQKMAQSLKASGTRESYLRLLPKMIADLKKDSRSSEPQLLPRLEALLNALRQET